MEVFCIFIFKSSIVSPYLDNLPTHKTTIFA